MYINQDRVGKIMAKSTLYKCFTSIQQRNNLKHLKIQKLSECGGTTDIAVLRNGSVDCWTVQSNWFFKDKETKTRAHKSAE